MRKTEGDDEGPSQRAPRVCVSPAGGGFPARAGGDAVVEGETAHYLVRVLRVREGDALTLFDGEGREVSVRVAAVTSEKRGAALRVRAEGDAYEGVRGDSLRVCWLQGVPKGDKLETVLREGTELGAHAFWPVYTQRSVPRPKGVPAGPDGDARVQRWRAVASSAAAQCGRADVPRVEPARPLEEALTRLPAWAALRIVPWEGGGEPLHAALARFAEALAGETHASPVPHAERPGCAVLVGPEGGLDVQEVSLARAHGFVPVSLGPRVLRTETVAAALLGVLSYALGDLRPAGSWVRR